VVFPALQILAAGDSFALKTTNFIDVQNGGSAMQARVVRTAVNRLKNIDKIVPGHAPFVVDDARPPMLYTWADLKEWADFNEDFLKWALSEKKSGKSVDEAASEYKSPEKYASYGPPIPNFVKQDLQAIYNDPTLK
jgi:hypothetical protein